MKFKLISDQWLEKILKRKCYNLELDKKHKKDVKDHKDKKHKKEKIAEEESVNIDNNEDDINENNSGDEDENNGVIRAKSWTTRRRSYLSM